MHTAAATATATATATAAAAAAATAAAATATEQESQDSGCYSPPGSPAHTHCPDRLVVDDAGPRPAWLDDTEAWPLADDIVCPPHFGPPLDCNLDHWPPRPCKHLRFSLSPGDGRDLNQMSAGSLSQRETETVLARLTARKQALAYKNLGAYNRSLSSPVGLCAFVRVKRRFIREDERARRLAVAAEKRADWRRDNWQLVAAASAAQLIAGPARGPAVTPAADPVDDTDIGICSDSLLSAWCAHHERAHA